MSAAVETKTRPQRAKVEQPSKKWAEMNGTEKLIFVAKVCVMVCSSGFLFANTLVE